MGVTQSGGAQSYFRNLLQASTGGSFAGVDLRNCSCSSKEELAFIIKCTFQAGLNIL